MAKSTPGNRFHMTLNARLWLVIITVAVSMLGLTILGAFESRAQQMRSLEGKLQSHIEAAVAVADAFRKRAAAGEMDAATAKREALREIGDMRWNGGKGYIFAFDSDMKLRLHPLRTSSIGKDISHDTDANGKPHYRIMRDADRAEGHGLTRYTQIIPKTKQTKDKISYSQWYKPWDLHLVTGAYFEDIDQAFRHQLVYNLTRTALVMLLALAVVWLTIRSIRRTIGGEPEHAVAMAERIAEGDLRGGGHDAGYREGSLLRALHHMRLRLTGIVGSVQQGSQQVSSAAQQISRGNDDLSQRPQEQASSLEETAASMEQITASVRNNASHASQADQMARGAREHAEQGGQVAEQAIAAMADISHSSHRIADIVGMIDEIAFQTNLLALNAAVEAARAGEHGRGFAVVATEVRQLAQRSAAAAKDIKTLIGESTERVQTGSDLVGRSAEALQTIVASVQKVTDLVAEISAANQEQTSGIDQVNRGVMQIDEVTQQNAALVEQVAAAARSMHEQADALAEQISYFTIDGGASAAASVQPALVRATPRGSEMALA